MGKYLGALALAAGLQVTGVAAADVVPTRDFFRDSEFQDIALSPSGRYLAVTLPRGSRTLAGVVDLKTRKIAAGLNFSEFDHAQDLQWISDDRFVFRVLQKYGLFFDGLFSNTFLFASDADGGRAWLVYPPKARVSRDKFPWRSSPVVVSPLLNKPDHVAIRMPSLYPDIIEVDTVRQNARNLMINPVPFGWPVMDEDGTVVAVVGVAEDSNESVVVLPEEDGQWKELSRAALGEGHAVPVGYFDGQLYMFSDQQAPRKRLLRQDMKTGQQDVVVSDPTYDVSGRVIASSDKKSALAVQYSGQYPRIEIINPTHPEANVLKSLIATFPDHAVWFSDFTKDGRFISLVAFSDREPGKIYLYDVENRRLEFLFSRRSWVDAEQMATRSPIQFRSRDGLDVHGYLTVPNGVAPKGLPLIVIPHGGPHGVRESWYYDPEAQFFAHHGYAVLQVNFRGSWGYGREFESAGFRRWGAEMVDDVTDGVRALIKSGVADEQRLCIYGASYGGYSAMMSAVREPDLYRCAVGYVGIYDLDLMHKKGDLSEHREGKEYLEDVIGTDSDWNRQYSPALHADKIKAEVLLAHGRLDYRADFAHYKRMAKALEKAGKSIESIVEDREAHGFYDIDNRVNLYDRMLAFFDRHIGDGARAATAISAQ